MNGEHLVASLAGTPAVRRDSGWWLVGRTGAVPATDPDLVADLDRLAGALAAADRAVAALRDAPRAGRGLR